MMRSNRVITVLLVSLFFSSNEAWTATVDKGDILERARKERDVTLYSTMPISEFPVFSQAAKEKYPFLNIRHVRIGSAAQVSKVMLEHKAGKIGADVIANSLATMLYYREHGVITQYAPSEPENSFIKGTIDPHGYWVGVGLDLLVTGSNTKLMTRDRVPKTFSEYLDPKFKDHMAIARNHPYPFVGLLELAGREKAISYMKSLGQQRPRQVEGYTHMTNLLAAGEFPLAIFTQVSKLEPMKKKGAPVDWKATAPTFATVSAVGVTRHASHPAAARLLVDFYLSAEGQQAMARTGKIPVRRGIKSSSAELDQLLESDQIQVLREEGDYSQYMRIFQESLGLF